MSGNYDFARREISQRSAKSAERERMLAAWPWFVRSIYLYLASLVLVPLIAAIVVWSLIK